jgi:2-C-methyl-D-erythritol 4-phosphate cytidylyltransferase
MKKFAVIVAGGSGSRMRSSLPKQFLLIDEKPLLFYTIRAFLDAFNDMSLILVLPEQFISNGQEIIDGYFDGSRIHVTAGGATRFESVRNGLALVEDESIVFVHDGVRCLVTTSLIHRCFDAAVEMGTAVPAVACKDSVRVLTDDGNEVLNRDLIRVIQTPQTFHSKIILPAYQIDYKDRFTDEATVVEAYGLKINLVEGEEENIKVTTPADLLVAESILLDRSKHHQRVNP